METKLDQWGFPIEEKKDREAGGDFFKFPEGDTKMRILTTPIMVRQVFEGGKFRIVDDPSVPYKAWAWAVIRETGEIKIVQIVPSIVKQLQHFLTDPDYAFEEYPMPYDITVNKQGEMLDTRYKLSVSRKNTPVTEEEKAELAKKTPISDIINKMRGKDGSKTESKKPAYPEPAEDEIPF